MEICIRRYSVLSPASFVVDIYIGLGVPIGTDAFIRQFVKDKCQAIMEDVDKLDNIPDGFIHYQLLRFCQATRLCVTCSTHRSISPSEILALSEILKVSALINF
jgi:hypothetical protein